MLDLAIHSLLLLDIAEGVCSLIMAVSVVFSEVGNGDLAILLF